MSIHDGIAADLAGLGGLLRCSTCDREPGLGGFERIRLERSDDNDINRPGVRDVDSRGGGASVLGELRIN